MPDPYQARVYGTRTSLVFSGFSKPYNNVNCADIYTIGARAQYEIVQNVVRNRGDGPIAQPNFQWHRYKTALTFNHKLDDELTWLMLSQAIQGVVDFGWDVGCLTIGEIVILDDTLGIVGTGELTYGRVGATANGTLTS